MIEDTLLAPPTFSVDTPFPPAPEEKRSTALKKRPVAKKVPAKKAAPARKTAAKKAAAAPPPAEELSLDMPPARPKARATAKSKNGAAVKAVSAEPASSPEPKPAPAPAPVIVEVRQEPAAPAAVAQAPAPAPAPVAVSAPVETTASAPAAALTHAPSSESQTSPSAAPAYAPAPRPVGPAPAPAPGSAPGQQDYARPPRDRDRDFRHGNKWKNRRDRDRDHRDRERGGDRDRDRDRQPNGGPSGQAQGQGGYQAQPPVEKPLGPPEPTEGILELTPKGYGFLRQKSRQYAPIPQDPWVSPELIRNLGLREGVMVKGVQQDGHRGPQVTKIIEVNGLDPEKIRHLPLFEELKAVNPNKRIQLETRPDRLTTRVIDLITPVGRGQRGLIVAPPRAGKTTLLQHIAEAVTENHPSTHLMILLVDERPEEVTEFRRVLPNAEIYASSNDNDNKSHIRIAMFAIERAKRLVEAGQHVFILMDSITRLGRAFNNAQKGGAIMSGGVGVGALEMPRRIFAAARNTRDAGSLTILATALIETNSRMDDLIFQEFKGTGNLELVLDRKIAEQYIYPAVNIFRSGTRREELLLPAFQMEKIHMLRRGLAGHKPMEAIQRVITLMERSPNNSQMLIELPGKTS